MDAAALQIRNLRKRYRGRRGVQANDGIDLEVPAGTVVGLLGHNGAGKTTLANQVVGLVLPDSGSVTVAGIDAVARPDLARAHVSVQAQANVPITGLSPLTAIRLVGRIRGGRAADVRARADRLIDALDLGPWANTPAEKVSGGVARLTAFAMAAIVPGELVILDEPTNDVDPVRRRLLWDAIGDLAAGGAGVLLVTHNVREAEHAVDTLTVLDHGRVLAAGTPAGLTAAVQDRLTLEVDLVPGAQVEVPDVARVVARTPVHLAAHVADDDAPAVVEWARRARGEGLIERYSLAGANLEDVYVALTGRDAEVGPGGAEDGTGRGKGSDSGNRKGGGSCEGRTGGQGRRDREDEQVALSTAGGGRR